MKAQRLIVLFLVGHYTPFSRFRSPCLSEEWYRIAAINRPPRSAPSQTSETQNRVSRFRVELRLCGVAAICAQGEGAIVVQLLVASPSHRVADALNVNLRLEAQALPFGPLRQHKLRLPNFSGQRISSIEAAALQLFSVLGLHRHTQNSGNPRDTVIGKAED